MQIEFAAKAMESSLFNNLKALLFHYRSRFLKAFFMVLISNCLLILNPLIFRQAVMHMDVHMQQPTGLLATTLHTFLGPNLQYLAAWIILLLCISFISAVFKYFMRVAFISVSRDAEKDVRSKLFAKIQAQSMAFYDRHGIGELLSRLTNDISAYRDVLGPGIMYPLFFLTLVIPGLAALFSISPSLTAVSIIPLIAIPLLNMTMRRKVYGISHQVQSGLADLSNMSQEHYSGERIIKGYAAEPEMSHTFSALCRNLITLNIKLNCYQGLLFPFFTMLTKIITIILVLFAGIIILSAWNTLNGADFVSFMWIQSYIFFPVLMMAWVLPLYERGRAAYDRLFEIYQEPIEVKEGKFSHAAIPPLADIEFRHLTFTYPTSSSGPTLKDFSLKITGGTCVGLTGPVGAGKTTLFRLLNREYEVPDNKIYIGGHDIHDYPLTAFNQEIVTVEQIPFLFSRTIAENVSFGKESASMEEIEIVSKFADLHESILDFPEKYETVIGERGITLSGGQKQRLAMARAFLVERSILLLDDVFSAIDADTEKRIFSAMQTNFKNKTIILITHRASILNKMDRVIYMNAGKIIEDGTPQELLKLEGHYAALAELQRLHAS